MACLFQVSTPGANQLKLKFCMKSSSLIDLLTILRTYGCLVPDVSRYAGKTGLIR